MFYLKSFEGFSLYNGEGKIVKVTFLKVYFDFKALSAKHLG